MHTLQHVIHVLSCVQGLCLHTYMNWSEAKSLARVPLVLPGCPPPVMVSALRRTIALSCPLFLWALIKTQVWTQSGRGILKCWIFFPPDRALAYLKGSSPGHKTETSQKLEGIHTPHPTHTLHATFHFFFFYFFCQNLTFPPCFCWFGFQINCFICYRAYSHLLKVMDK